MFKVTKIDRIWKYEDFEIGESSHEPEVEELTLSFRELVNLIQNNGYFYPSCSPLKSGDDFWLDAESDENFITGTRTESSLHLADKRHLKRWYQAFQTAHR